MNKRPTGVESLQIIDKTEPSGGMGTAQMMYIVARQLLQNVRNFSSPRVLLDMATLLFSSSQSAHATRKTVSIRGDA
jgi:hypothetical protein